MNNRRFEELKTTEDKEGLIRLSYDQINFDYHMKIKIEQRYERERALRFEAAQEVRTRRAKIMQLAQEVEEARRSIMRRLLPPEPSLREEVTKAPHEANRGPTQWPLPPQTSQTMWHPPLRLHEVNSRVQVDTNPKRTRHTFSLSTVH